MNELTYIFGAGASYYSMPLVSSFIERFSVFEECLNIPLSGDDCLLSDIRKFKENIKVHYSFDTYFKKLFHKPNSENEMAAGKNVLFIYLLFEHLITMDILDTKGKHIELKNKGLNKQYLIDPRYEALIAGLLKPKKGCFEFHANVNFITWNYDMNLLYALYNFMSPQEEFYTFIKNRIKDEYIEISDQIKVFHMNGLLLHPSLNKFNTSDSFSEFEKVIRGDNSGYIPNIRFAWENDNGVLPSLAAAITRSKFIVFIGYSLPLYNRLVDKSYLNYLYFKNPSIVIQDFNALGLKGILNTNFAMSELGRNGPTIQTIEACNSFYIPNI